MAFCVSLSRTGLIIFNVLFFLAGLAILIVGSVFVVRGNTYGIDAPTSIGTWPPLAVAVAVVPPGSAC